MRKITWIPLLIIIIGVCLALAGFAGGGMKWFWPGAPAAPFAPAAPVAPNAPEPPDAPDAPEPPEPPGLLRGIMGFWLDRGGIHYSNSNLGALVKVDESYGSTAVNDIKLDVDFIGRITLKEGDAFTVRGQNYERFGGLSARLDGDTLLVKAKRESRWLSMGIDNLFARGERDAWLEITYPAGASLGLVSADLDAGRISITGLRCKELYVNNSFGRTEVREITCETLSAISASGDAMLTDIDAAGKATVKNDFGSVELRNVSADDLSVGLNAGDVNARNITAGSLDVKNDFGKITLEEATSDRLTLKLNSGDLVADGVTTRDLSVKSDFGLIRMDRLAFSGRGDIVQNSGDVRLSLAMSEDDLSYEISTSAGNVTIDERRMGNSSALRNAGASVSLSVDSDFGNVALRFLQ